MFKKATKEKLKLRAAFFGPSGAGKTFSALRVARGLGGRVAVIDTERRSASKYADRFEFDVCDLEDRTIDGYVKAMSAAAGACYEVLVLDSLSHAWQELLEEVDRITNSNRHKGNKWSAWSEGTPKQRKLVEAILSYPGHVIATMRSKTEWVTVEGRDGKKKPERVGLSPEQGKGIEYEFDLLVEISVDHVAQVIKDRTGKFQDQTIDKPGEDFGQALAAWLDEGAEPAPPPSPPAPSAKAREAKLKKALRKVATLDAVGRAKALRATEDAGALHLDDLNVLTVFCMGQDNIDAGRVPDAGMTPDEVALWERAVSLVEGGQEVAA